jgi:acetolactate synthase small subunit
MSVTDRRSDPIYCFSVFAAAEASVMPRVLELFAKRGLVPRRLDAAVGGADDEELVVDLQVDGLAPETAEHIAASLRQMVHVDRVLTAIRGAQSHAAGAAFGARR